MRKPTPDLIGKRFGRLVVKKKSPEKGHSTFWICRCDCGNKKKATTSNLLAGITKSCGCMDKENRARFAKLNFKDLTGEKFGMLKVLRQSIGVKKGSGATWFCKCDCGNYTDVASTKLIQGTTKSCGCQLKKAREKWKTIYKDEEIQTKKKRTFRKNDGREKNTKLSILKLATSAPILVFGTQMSKYLCTKY